MIGLDPLPKRAPLQVTLVRTIQRDEYVVDVLHFQSIPKLFVTSNVYRPIKKGNGPFPAVILGPGHQSHPQGGKVARQNYAIPWVRAGYIAMVIDPIQVAELFAVHRGTASFQMWDWYARGYTPIGVEVWNAMRAVDYLLTRSDVDGEKLTINGCSGGGHLSWMLAAADERIAVAQPVAGTADIRSHIVDHLQEMHCDCAFFINTYRHDWPTLAALIAPRPLLIHGSTEDVYYPPKSYNAVFDGHRLFIRIFMRVTRLTSSRLLASTPTRRPSESVPCFGAIAGCKGIEFLSWNVPSTKYQASDYPPSETLSRRILTTASTSCSFQLRRYLAMRA